MLPLKMVRGKLGLRIGSGKGDVAALCHPGEMLFCVVGVGSTRYRSAAVQPASPVWNEQFYFTVSNEAEVVLEVPCMLCDWRRMHVLRGAHQLSLDCAQHPRNVCHLTWPSSTGPAMSSNPASRSAGEGLPTGSSTLPLAGQPFLRWLPILQDPNTLTSMTVAVLRG